MQDEAAKHSQKKDRAPIKADCVAVQLAAKINALLIEPIAVLPVAEGELMRPLAIGLGREIKARLRPDTASKDLNRTLRGYTRCASYLLSLCQPKAMRHDLAGEPVELVSKEDRNSAHKNFMALLARRKQRRQQPAETAERILEERGLSFQPNRKPVPPEAYHELDPE